MAFDLWLSSQPQNSGGAPAAEDWRLSWPEWLVTHQDRTPTNSYSSQHLHGSTKIDFVDVPNTKKVKESCTHYRAKGPELILVYRQSACR